MRHFLVILLSFLVTVSAGANIAAGELAVHFRAGASRVTGDLFEDTSFRAIYGLGLMYPVTESFSLGIQGGYTKWTPDVVLGPPGSSRMVEGTAKNSELLAVARYDLPWERSDRLSLFGEAGFGYCIVDSDVKVYSRALVLDPGPWELWYTIDSQNKPCISGGIGLAYRIAERVGLEILGDYSYIFTDGEPTKYYSINGGLVIWIL